MGVTLSVINTLQAIPNRGYWLTDKRMMLFVLVFSWATGNCCSLKRAMILGQMPICFPILALPWCNLVRCKPVIARAVWTVRTGKANHRVVLQTTGKPPLPWQMPPFSETVTGGVVQMMVMETLRMMAKHPTAIAWWKVTKVLAQGCMLGLACFIGIGISP